MEYLPHKIAQRKISEIKAAESKVAILGKWFAQQHMDGSTENMEQLSSSPVPFCFIFIFGSE